MIRDPDSPAFRSEPGNRGPGSYLDVIRMRTSKEGDPGTPGWAKRLNHTTSLYSSAEPATNDIAREQADVIRRLEVFKHYAALTTLDNRIIR